MYVCVCVSVHMLLNKLCVSQNMNTVCESVCVRQGNQTDRQGATARRCPLITKKEDKKIILKSGGQYQNW